jgi:hypothetical protein
MTTSPGKVVKGRLRAAFADLYRPQRSR